MRRDGVIDPELEAITKESQRTIESHLEDFESKLRAAGRSEKHINSTNNFIRSIAMFAEFIAAADITADGVTRYAEKLGSEGRAARTIEAHLNAITAFTKWLCENHKLSRDPLAGIKKPNPAADRRLERRMLLPDEWRLLETATMTGPNRYGMPPVERALLYRVGIETGLRSNEIRSLTRGNIFHSESQPYIVAKAGNTKNKKLAKQYITPELAADLRVHIGSKTPKAPVFALPHETNVARMLRADLAAARNAWLREAIGNPDEYAHRELSDFLSEKNHDGEQFDFHCLRHTCGAWLAMTGEHPKVVQTVMRHQSITLTMDTYAHLFPGHEADAVNQLRELMAPSHELMQATGTDDTRAAHAQRAGSETGRIGAKLCDGHAHDKQQRETPNPLGNAGLGVVLRDDASECEGSGEGTEPLTRGL